ncbi:MAG: YtxH domain-containing protein [Acidobacteria bacterium]|nr:YtxH domain-containing protein [Acidobacteriota bacterium]
MNNIDKFDHGYVPSSDAKGSIGKTVGYLLIGGGIGAALALLFAPKSGSEFRGDIADVTRKGYDSTLEGAKVIKEKSANVIHMVSEKADSAIDYASSKLSNRSDVVSDAASTVKETVADGIDRMQNESANVAQSVSKAAKAV